MILENYIILIALSGVIPASLSEVYIRYTDVNKEYKFHMTPLKWYDAKLKCESEHAELAMPSNQEEATIITNIFQGYTKAMLTGVVHPDYVLLGFHDTFLESEFLTLKGESIQYYFHSWANGQPDNYNNEDCGSLHRSGKLNDFPCEIPGTFICQKQGNSTKQLMPIERCVTGDPAYQYAQEIDKYYKVHMNPRIWPDARIICALEGGHLAIIRNKAEEKHLEKIFNDPINKVHYTQHKDYALLGFHDLYREAHFTTVLDESLHDIGYVNWASGQPDNYNGEHCGSMYKTGALNDFPCGVPAVFICELEASIIFDVRFSNTK